MAFLLSSMGAMMIFCEVIKIWNLFVFFLCTLSCGALTRTQPVSNVTTYFKSRIFHVCYHPLPE
jgi:hypothetical protein